MSGGAFDYQQYRLLELSQDIIDELVCSSFTYSDKTRKEFEKAHDLLRQAYIYVQRIDWLVSGDDSEESFHKRLKEDLDNDKKEHIKGKSNGFKLVPPYCCCSCKECYYDENDNYDVSKVKSLTRVEKDNMENSGTYKCKKLKSKIVKPYCGILENCPYLKNTDNKKDYNLIEKLKE